MMPPLHPTQGTGTGRPLPGGQQLRTPYTLHPSFSPAAPVCPSASSRMRCADPPHIKNLTGGKWCKYHFFTANYLSPFSSSPAFPSLVWASRLGLWGGTAPCWGVRVHPALGHFAALVLPRFCRALSAARGGQPLGALGYFSPKGSSVPDSFDF